MTNQGHWLCWLIPEVSSKNSGTKAGRSEEKLKTNFKLLWLSLQICCELEESSNCCLSGPLQVRDSLQVYHIPLNTPMACGPPLVEEIQDLLKVFVNRRSSMLSCHPSSRTSSTEGVAGSVEFSQGSSGINDMDGSDMERPEGGTGEMATLPK